MTVLRTRTALRTRASLRCPAALRTLTAVLLAASTFALAGCTWGSAPAEVRDEAQSLVTEIRAIDGIDSAEVSVSGGGMLDPNEFFFRFDVTAASSTGLEHIPQRISGITAGARVGATDSGAARTVAVSVSLLVPARLGAAEVTLHNLSEESVAAALALRGISGVKSVNMGDAASGGSVDAWPGVSPGTLAASLRGLNGFGQPEGFGQESLTSVTVNWSGAAGQVGEDKVTHSAQIGAATPGVEILDALDELGRDSTVASIYARQSDTWTGVADPSSGRPTVSITVDNADPVVNLLATTIDSAADAGLAPRTAFEVTSAAGRVVEGYVGLPLGTPEPDDLPDPPAPIEPVTPQPLPAEVAPVEWVPSEDPAVLAQLAIYSGDVEAFLARAEQIAGVSGEHSVGAGQCPAGGATTSVHGSVVIPIFQISDSADEAFTAITSDWQSAGLVRSDRALGLDLYSSRVADASIAGATIRGTTEGISISANSACR